jgi:hypothetical protein
LTGIENSNEWVHVDDHLATEKERVLILQNFDFEATSAFTSPPSAAPQHAALSAGDALESSFSPLDQIKMIRPGASQLTECRTRLSRLGSDSAIRTDSPSSEISARPEDDSDDDLDDNSGDTSMKRETKASRGRKGKREGGNLSSRQENCGSDAGGDEDDEEEKEVSDKYYFADFADLGMGTLAPHVSVTAR